MDEPDPTAAPPLAESVGSTAQVEQVVNSVGSTAQISPRSRGGTKWTDDETELALLQMVESGVPTREAAKQLGLNLRTAFGLLARNEEQLDAIRGATRRLMAAQSLEAIDHWRVAMDVGARKKGNHAPARDWLLHAGVIDALQGEHSSVKIAINIGTDERPMRLPSPLDVVVDAEKVE